MTYEYSSYQSKDGLHLSLKADGKTIWQISYPCFIENALDGELIEDLTLIDLGVMKSVDDVQGLCAYLKEKGIVPNDCHIGNSVFARGGTIGGDTAILPELVADQVAAKVVSSESPVKELSINQKSSIVVRLTDFLVKKANAAYVTNKEFAAKLNAKNNAGRNVLQMYMNHWAQLWIKKGQWRFEHGGSVSFNDKVKSISDSLVGKEVPKEYQPVYGKIYNKITAKMAARKIAGAQVRDENR